MTQSPPIRRWRIVNLKSVERAELDLAPLTVLVGANSSGKSTFLQSMLLAVQAAQASTLGGVFPLNGPLVQLGEFADAHAAFAPGRRTAIGGVFSVGSSQGMESLTADWQIELSGRVPSQPGSTRITSVALTLGDGSGRRGAHPRSTVRARARGDDDRGAPGPVVRNRATAGMPSGPAGIVGWHGTVTDGRRTSRIEGLRLVAGFPAQVLTPADAHHELADMWLWRLTSMVGQGASRRERGAYLQPGVAAITTAIADDAAADVRSWLTAHPGPLAWLGEPEFPSLRAWTRVRTATKARSILSSPEAAATLEDAITERLGSGAPVLRATDVDEDALEPLRTLAEKVTYLGPLRQEPQVVYRTISSLHPRFLGTKGEYVAPVLHRLRDEPITTPLPDGTTGSVRLQEAMDLWLNHLEAAGSIESHDTGRLGYDLRVTQPGLPRPVDLTSVGVGVSQVVPVVMVCLLAEPGSVVLLEQPELHLHPGMQQRLADFFLALARSGRQFIIETHSEYIVTRLRLRMAQGHSDTDRGLVSLVNASKHSGRTRFETISVNQYGTIEDWPSGFFNQASDDARDLLDAGLRKLTG